MNIGTICTLIIWNVRNLKSVNRKYNQLRNMICIINEYFARHVNVTTYIKLLKLEI